MITGVEELDRFLDRSTKLFGQALLNLLRAKYDTQDGDYSRALADLARLLQHTMILGNLFARKRVLMESKAEGQFAGLPDRTPLSYDLPFVQAIEDLIKREPRLANSAAEVSRLYNESKVFAMARSISQKLTNRVQETLVSIVAEGRGGRHSQRELLKIAAEESHEWTIAYADTVYETNLSTVYNEGRMVQAKDPEVAKVISALEVVGVADGRERKNHSYARGLIAAQGSPIWTKAMPPYGYRCRHGVILVSKYTLQNRGLTQPDANGVFYYPPNFSKFEPDPGFGGGQF